MMLSSYFEVIMSKYIVDNYIGSNQILSSHVITYNNHTMNYNHMHKSYEIYLPIIENVNYFINEKSYVLSSSTVLLLTSHDLHKSNVPDNTRYERYIFLFDPALIENRFNTDLLKCFDNKMLKLSAEEISKLTEYFNEAIALNLNKNTFAVDINENIILYKILILLNKNSMKDKSTYEHTAGNVMMDNLIGHITDNLADDLSLKSLSEKFFISQYHLNRMFKRYSGFTIHNYIINLRIFTAKKYLLDGLSVNLAGQKVGYSNLANFSRTFKQHAGISPKQYAKTNSENRQ